MNSFLKLIVFIAIIISLDQEVNAQRNFYFNNVKEAVKLPNRWGVAIKKDVNCMIRSYDDNKKAYVSFKGEDSISYYLPLKLDSVSKSKRAFYTITEIDELKNYKWRSNTGNKEVAQVIFNLPISDIFSWRPSTLNFEIRFKDGSGLYYFLKP